ncbi:hypothetical protein WME73_35910 [Sorangium sp. So ce302]|uniref:hypothetical protein n=1 Tax=Sorangium sp. So ce302 TaxID=3133297 RepID=UPI003F619D9F
MSRLPKETEGAPFLPLAAVEESLARGGVPHEVSGLLLELVHMGVLPRYTAADAEVVLQDDLLEVMACIDAALEDPRAVVFQADLFSRGALSSFPVLPGTTVELLRNPEELPHAFSPAIRNLLRTVAAVKLGDKEKLINYIGASRLLTSSRVALEHSIEQVERANIISGQRASTFANSAYYMGSKRALAGFLVEALAGILPPDGVVFDLMCGSGAASGAFASTWRTIASDAQAFSIHLATVQGGGMTVARARALLSRIMPAAREHVVTLRPLLGELMTIEDDIMHGNIDEDAVRRYREFVRAVPVYPSCATMGSWNPSSEVHRRKAGARETPYLLFAAYFANVYFGLRQCVEVDSLRFAIESVAEHQDRTFALGALVATLSALGTTYAAHFAQPPIRCAEDISVANLHRILDTRGRSVFHEFEMRLLSLAEASEGCRYPIEPVEGPWSNALKWAQRELRNQPVAVYVDAPYTRDEYSRYYHLLETAVTYNYPSSDGVGRVPSKRAGDRFASEFFTRSRERFERTLATIISTVVQQGYTCAWSCASSGVPRIDAVISQVVGSTGVSVRSVAAAYSHKAQGGRRAKEVVEYLLMFGSARKA